MKKLVLVSKYLFFDNNDNLISKNLKWIDQCHDKDLCIAILAREQSNKKLRGLLPEEYKEKLKFVSRSNDSYNKIRESIKKGHLISIVGVVDADAISAFQCKVPLFNPTFLQSNTLKIEEKVKNYGLPILSMSDVIECNIAYGLATKTYFQAESHKGNYKVLSLNNANTLHKIETEQRIKKLFQTNLKNDLNNSDRRVLLILYFHLIHEVLTNPLFEKVRYWGHFPSSSMDKNDTPTVQLKEALRKLINGMPRNNVPIFIRSKDTPKKQFRSNEKLNDKCELDFDSLYINPKLKGKLKGREVCIIDDYITTGYSAEAAKHLLFMAGASKVIFLSIGKFGKTYNDTEYEIEGDVFSDDYRANFMGQKQIQNQYYEAEADLEILRFDELLSDAP